MELVGWLEEDLGRRLQWLAIVADVRKTAVVVVAVTYEEEGHSGASVGAASGRRVCIVEGIEEEFPGVVGTVVGGIVEGRKAGCTDSGRDCDCMLPALEDSEGVDSGCIVFSFPHLVACPALPADGGRSSPCRRGSSLPKRRRDGVRLEVRVAVGEAEKLLERDADELGWFGELRE